MSKFIQVLGQRRKAIAALLGVAAELITEAVPQTNPQNALLLHAVLAVVTVFMVHATPNDGKPADSVQEFIDDLIHGDPKHAAAPAAPAAPLG